MAEQRRTAAAATPRELVMTRVVDAPRELVWKAWTEPERLAQWWGPKGFTMLASEMDLRPGGIYHYGMRAPSGQDMWGTLTYREIDPPQRLVFVVSFSDKDANIVRHPMSPNWPLEVLTTLTFTEHQGKTTLTLAGGPINATEAERAAYRDGHKSMQQGFKGTFDQLAEYLLNNKE